MPNLSSFVVLFMRHALLSYHEYALFTRELFSILLCVNDMIIVRNDASTIIFLKHFQCQFEMMDLSPLR